MELALVLAYLFLAMFWAFLAGAKVKRGETFDVVWAGSVAVLWLISAILKILEVLATLKG